MILVLFRSRRTAYIVRDNTKKNYVSRFILQGRNIILKNILDFDVVYVKLNNISCEFPGLNYVATLRCSEGIFMTT